MKLTNEQIQYAVEYLAGNLSIEECETSESSVTIQAMADVFKHFDSTFNKMRFTSDVRRAARDEMASFTEPDTMCRYTVAFAPHSDICHYATRNGTFTICGRRTNRQWTMYKGSTDTITCKKCNS